VAAQVTNVTHDYYTCEISQMDLSTREKDNNSRIPQCLICYEDKNAVHYLSCCHNYVCELCQLYYLKINIEKNDIHCISCDHILNKNEILTYLHNDLDLIKKYRQRISCPQCHSFQIKLIKKYLIFKSNHLICQSCSYEWCKQCHLTWHQNMSCSEYKQGDIPLKQWAKRRDKDNQYNAHQCPKCGIYIQRNEGCPHMTCSQCSCQFCYNCGKQRITLKWLGSHDSKFSPLG
ncbi:unnamed protein product, partial [Didymodactylos carnosus]